MAYRVELTFRAFGDLERLYLVMEATGSEQAIAWFQWTAGGDFQFVRLPGSVSGHARKQNDAPYFVREGMACPSRDLRNRRKCEGR